MNQNSDQRKILCALCHGSIFFSATLISVGIPIAILFISNDPAVQGNAKESLNFHFNVWLYGIIFGLLTFVLIGIPLLFILGLVTLIAPILAMVKVLSDPNTIFRYPFIFRLL